MVSIYNIKPAFQALLRPLLRLLVRVGITPNQITVSAILLSLVGGALIWASQSQPFFLLAVPVIMLVRMALNALDGMLAREYNQASPVGEIINEVGDILSDTVLYLPLIGLFYSSMSTVLLIGFYILLACLSEFCGVLAKAMTSTRRYDGPMGKSDRAFCISILALALFFFPSLTQSNSHFVFLAMDLLLLLSCYNRLRYIPRNMKDSARV
jgi:CDP-diacylglycerol--glycerol-3-phosphate 3-phosphatidyltransferase